MENLLRFAQATSEVNVSAGIGSTLSLLILLVVVISIAAVWKMFTKAGQPGWASIIPIYNAYIIIKIAGKPGWWVLLYLIPFVNIIVSILVSVDLAKAYGKSDAFGVILLWLLSPIGHLIIGFGDATYQGVASESGSSNPPATNQPVQM